MTERVDLEHLIPWMDPETGVPSSAVCLSILEPLAERADADGIEFLSLNEVWIEPETLQVHSEHAPTPQAVARLLGPLLGEEDRDSPATARDLLDKVRDEEFGGWAESSNALVMNLRRAFGTPAANAELSELVARAQTGRPEPRTPEAVVRIATPRRGNVQLSSAPKARSTAKAKLDRRDSILIRRPSALMGWLWALVLGGAAGWFVLEYLAG